MGLREWLSSLWKGNPQSTKAPSGEAADLRNALQVINDFAATLKRVRESNLWGSKYPEDELPHERSSIAESIQTLLVTIADPAQRSLLSQCLPPVAAQQALSSEFQDSLGQLQAILAFQFVTREAAEHDRILTAIACQPNLTTAERLSLIAKLPEPPKR